MEIRYTNPQDLKPHPLNLKLVPEMAPEEFEALVEDVREKGVLQPLEVLKDTNLILDGRNRWKAALQANLSSVPCREVDVPEEEVALYVLERVPTHRSLSPGVRAALAAEWVEAMKPQISRGRPSEKNPQKIADFSIGRPGLRRVAATKFGVNHQYVQIALNLRKYAPESFELLKRGEISLQEAQGILTRAGIKMEAAEIVAFSSPVLLKRTHHVGEEAQDHSQTHDPRGTQGLQEEARPLAGRSCKVVRYRTKRGQSLGNRQKKNPSLLIRTFGLPRKRKQDLKRLQPPMSLDNYNVIDLYRSITL